MVGSPLPMAHVEDFLVNAILGLDLGKQVDPAALAGIDVKLRPNPLRPTELEKVYDVIALHRWPRLTPYTQIVSEVSLWVTRPPWDQPSLAFDKGHVGGAVFEMFQRAQPRCWLRPITITSGRAVTPQDDGGWHVAKSELASVLVAVHASGRVRIAPQSEAKILTQQIGSFTTKIVNGDVLSFDNPRDETGHGDVAMAVALAIWLGERTPFAWDGSLGLPKSESAGMTAGAAARSSVFAASDMPDPWGMGPGREDGDDEPERGTSLFQAPQPRR